MRNLLRRLFRRSTLDKGVQEEIESHIAMRAELNEESGMPADDAVQTARRQFGNRTSVRENIYDFHGFGWLDATSRDVAYALRGLRRSPGVSLTAVLTIAIGVGAITGMFNVMRNLLLAPPPHVAEPDSVFRFYQAFFEESMNALGEPFSGTSYPFYEIVRDQAQTVESVAVYRQTELAAGTGSDARMTRAVLVSPGFWNMLRVEPALGRLIADDEAHPATGARVAVLGHAFWHSRFGGQPGAIGETLEIKGQPYTVVGIAPRGFRGVELSDVDLWLPLFAESP